MDPVIDHANQLAAEHGATITVLHVVNTSSFGSLPMEAEWETLTDELKDEGETALTQAAERISGDAETMLKEGTPYEIITEQAETGEYDVIVMGTSGRGGFDRVVLGSVAERVVRHSPIPVLTIRIGDLSAE